MTEEEIKQIVGTIMCGIKDLVKSEVRTEVQSFGANDLHERISRLEKKLGLEDTYSNQWGFTPLEPRVSRIEFMVDTGGTTARET